MSEQVPTLVNRLPIDSQAGSSVTITTQADSDLDDVATDASSLQAQAICLLTASATIMQHKDVMARRAATTVVASDTVYEELLAAADRLSASLKQTARVRNADLQRFLSKAADDHEMLATLMDAGAYIGDAMHSNVHLFLASLASLDKLAQSIDCDGARLCVPVSMLAASSLANMSTVWSDLPDGTVSTVSGRGMKSFVKGAAGATRNVVLVYPRVSTGALAAYVKPDDVCLMLRDATGSLIDANITFHSVDGGILQLAYTVAGDCVNKLIVSVMVCGAVLSADAIVQSGYDAINGTKHVASYEFRLSRYAFVLEYIAISADESLMLVSCSIPGEVRVFRLTPRFEEVTRFGRFGSGPVEFVLPRCICFLNDDMFFVCDYKNNRAQLITVGGVFVGALPVPSPISVAVHEKCAAFGTEMGTIELHSLETGQVVRVFGSLGRGPGQIGHYASGLKFTLDGAHLLVAECQYNRLSMFTVTGEFVKRIGVGAVGNGEKDACFGADGEIIVTDKCNNRICVFSSDGCTLIKSWGSQGSADGQFRQPRALAISGSRLYVMDAARVQVFE